MSRTTQHVCEMVCLMGRFQVSAQGEHTPLVTTVVAASKGDVGIANAGEVCTSAAVPTATYSHYPIATAMAAHTSRRHRNPPARTHILIPH
jgi:hypothetical protein